MPKLENFATFIKINGNPFAKNAINYQVQSGDTIGLYYTNDRDQRILKGTMARFDDWTDSNDDAYSSFAALISDIDIFLFSVTSSIPGLEIARGEYPGQTGVIIRGHQPNQSAASGFVDVAEDGDLVYLTTAETMNIVSDSDDDDSAGIGLRTLLIQGVDNDGAAIQEVVVMDGTNDVETSLSYLRVNLLLGLTAGSSGWNVGDITAIASSAATIQTQMGPTESLSQSSHYTVPLNKKFYLTQVEFNAAKISGGGSPEIEFKGYFRIGGAGAAWLQGFDKRMDTDVTDVIDVFLPIPTQFAGRTDVRLRADTDTNSTEMRTRMYGILIDD